MEFPKVALSAGAWDAHAALMHRSPATAIRLRRAREISTSVDSDDFGETIARFAAPAERSFLECGGAQLSSRYRAEAALNTARSQTDHLVRALGGGGAAGRRR